MEQTFSPSPFAPTDAPASARVSAFAALRRLVARAERAAARRASLRALGRLDPHLLADIGVTRADVERELREGGVSA